MSLDSFPLLADLIAKRRGGENWPETNATVFSRERIEDRNGGAITRITFTYWVGEDIQEGMFDVTNSETDLNKDDTFLVHYDPAKPTRHFYAPAAQGSAKALWAGAGMALLSFGMILMLVLFAHY